MDQTWTIPLVEIRLGSVHSSHIAHCCSVTTNIQKSPVLLIFYFYPVIKLVGHCLNRFLLGVGGGGGGRGGGGRGRGRGERGSGRGVGIGVGGGG